MIQLQFIYLGLLLLLLTEIANSTPKTPLKTKIKHHCQSLKRELAIPSRSKEVYPALFFSDYWDPSWQCPNEVKIGRRFGGSDGSKWVCSPSKLTPDACLVYSFGSFGQYHFEQELFTRYGCEIHVFDPFHSTVDPNGGAVQLPDSNTTIHVHPWGLAPSSFTFTLPAVGGDPPREGVLMKSLADIIDVLGHQQRVLDILKVDIEGCEFDIFDQPSTWNALRERGVTVDQFLLELHRLGVNKDNYRYRPAIGYSGARSDALLRAVSSAGLAMFHKEVNMESGTCIEFSFVRLDLDCDRNPPGPGLPPGMRGDNGVLPQSKFLE